MDKSWVRTIPFQGHHTREGMISEDTCATLFEGEYKKQSDGSRIMEGIFQRANTRNKNGRIYPFNILERETNKLQDMIKECGGILGELDHPETVNINLQKACLRLDRLNMNKEGVVEGRMSLLPELPLGAAAIGCCDALGGKSGVSSRGAGSLFQNGPNTMVGEDYNMRTYDMVHDPSTPGARPVAVSESLIREFFEFHKLRPATQRMQIASLVDRWLGI